MGTFRGRFRDVHAGREVTKSDKLVKKSYKNVNSSDKLVNFHNLVRKVITKASTYPTDTSSSIHHPFDVEIPRGKFVEITSILKGESTWKL